MSGDASLGCVGRTAIAARLVGKARLNASVVGQFREDFSGPIRLSMRRAGLRMASQSATKRELAIRLDLYGHFFSPALQFVTPSEATQTPRTGHSSWGFLDNFRCSRLTIGILSVDTMAAKNGSAYVGAKLISVASFRRPSRTFSATNSTVCAGGKFRRIASRLGTAAARRPRAFSAKFVAVM